MLSNIFVIFNVDLLVGTYLILKKNLLFNNKAIETTNLLFIFYPDLQHAKEIQQLSSDAESAFTETEDKDIRFEKLLESKHRHQKQQMNNKPTFNSALLGFAEMERLPHNTNVLEFWQQNEKLYASLTAAARVVFSVPGTQVSVEQLFSQLKFIYSDLRGSLHPRNINNILIVRSNFEFVNDDMFYKKI